MPASSAPPITPLATVVIDDASSTRRFLRAVLDDSGLFEVVGEADSGASALALPGDLRPGLVLLDLSMPGMDGRASLPAIAGRWPSAEVVVLSNHPDSVGQSVVDQGALAYLEKGLAPDELLARLADLVGIDPARAAHRAPEAEGPTAAAGLTDPGLTEPGLAEPGLAEPGVVVRCALVVESDPMARRQLAWMLARCGADAVVEVVTTGPDLTASLRHMVRATAPRLVVIGHVDSARAGDLCAEVEQVAAGTPVVGYTGPGDDARSLPAGVGAAERPDLEALEALSLPHLAQPGGRSPAKRSPAVPR